MKILLKIKNKIRSIFVSKIIHPENSDLLNLFEIYQQAAIFGSGPSINNLDVTAFKDDFVITMGNFCEHPDIEKINPKIHIFAASHPPITEKVLVDWWTRSHEMLPKQTPVLIEKRDHEIAKKIFKNRRVFLYSYGGILPVDFTKRVMSPWSVTIVALQLAVYCKTKKINLLGINHDWQCIHPYVHFYNHEKPSLEYYLKKEGIKISYEEQKQPFPKERLYREYELYQQYESLKKEAEKMRLHIVNADPFSHFDVFPFEKRMDLIKNKNS